MGKRKARKQTKGKPLFGGLPSWLGGLAIAIGIIGIVAMVVLVRISPANQIAGPSDSGDELNAAIIDQLYTFDLPNQKFINEVTDMLESYGFQVDLYQGDEVTVDLYRRLPKGGHELIIFRTHSGVLEGVTELGEQVGRITSLFTSERYSRSKYVKEQLNWELLKANVGEGYPLYFAVAPKFITNSMRGQFNDTVIIIAGCSGLYVHDLAQAFIHKGASAYLAWNATVSAHYVDGATIALVRNLTAEGLTINQAVAKTMEKKGADPEWGAVLKYYPAQSGTKTIAELIGRSN